MDVGQAPCAFDQQAYILARIVATADERDDWSPWGPLRGRCEATRVDRDRQDAYVVALRRRGDVVTARGARRVELPRVAEDVAFDSAQHRHAGGSDGPSRLREAGSAS